MKQLSENEELKKRIRVIDGDWDRVVENGEIYKNDGLGQRGRGVGNMGKIRFN